MTLIEAAFLLVSYSRDDSLDLNPGGEVGVDDCGAAEAEPGDDHQSRANAFASP